MDPERTRALTIEEVRGILPRGGTILGTTNRGNPFAYRVREGDSIRIEDRSELCLATARALGIEALVVVGGDGSLTIAHQIHQEGLPVVGVPKTIDNDLSATDVTFGFDTAVATATEAIDRLHTTAESHDRVMLVEVMGRHVGHIATWSGIAGGATMILIPEEPFDIDEVCATLRRRHDQGRFASIVVVAEGAVPVEGTFVLPDPGLDRFGHQRLGGIAHALAPEIEGRTGFETKVVVLGYLQRGGSPTATDRVLASRFGVAAAEAAADGAWGKMVAIQGGRIVLVPLSEAVAEPKVVSADIHDVGKVFFA